ARQPAAALAEIFGAEASAAATDVRQIERERMTRWATRRDKVAALSALLARMAPGDADKVIDQLAGDKAQVRRGHGSEELLPVLAAASTGWMRQRWEAAAKEYLERPGSRREGTGNLALFAPYLPRGEGRPPTAEVVARLLEALGRADDLDAARAVA